jgi:hypothetical protein
VSIERLWNCPGLGYAAASAVRVLVLRQAQDEDEFAGGSVEILILTLSKDEDFSAIVGQYPRAL